jgi:hypothetical protein
MICSMLQQLAASYHDRHPHRLDLMGFNSHALEHGSHMPELRYRPGCQLSNFAVDQLNSGKDLFLGGKYLASTASNEARLGYQQERRDMEYLKGVAK